MKKNLFLLGIGVILLILFLLLPETKKEETKKESSGPIQLLSIPEPQLKAVTLFLDKNKKIVVRKEETKEGQESQYIIENIGKKAGIQEVMELVSHINSIQGFPLEITQEQLAKFEKKDNRSLVVEKKDGTKLSLSILDKREIGEESYFVQTGEKLFVVQKSLIDLIFQKKEEDLRDHLFVNYTSKDMDSFSINNKIEFYQKEEGKWFIKDLKEEETDTNKVFQTFASISSIRIKGFTNSTNKAQYNLVSPAYTVILKKKDKKEKKLYFAEKNKKYYAYHDENPEIVEIYETDWQNIIKKREAYKKEKEEQKKDK